MDSQLWFSILVGVGLDRCESLVDGLTTNQRQIRDRCGNVPKRIRRSIDAYRLACGMVPLWPDLPKLHSTGDYHRDQMRRKRDRERQRRRRLNLRGGH
jgi:hypothetical protein